MIVELDGLYERHHRLDFLVALREANPLFRCTVYAVPYLSPDEFLESLPEWVDVAVYGWDHRHRRECAGWTKEQALDVLLACDGRFVDGFKAPSDAISAGLYEALLELGWWVRDVRANDRLRPAGIRVFRGGGADRWFGTVEDLGRSFGVLRERVRHAGSFELVSEAAVEWRPEPVAA